MPTMNPYNENECILASQTVLAMFTLSWGAKGLWIYLQGRNPEEEIKVKDLCERFPGGKQKIYRLLRELIAHGLCFGYHEREGSVRLGNVKYIIFEKPDPQKFRELKNKYKKINNTKGDV